MDTNNLHNLLQKAAEQQENIPLQSNHTERFEAKLHAASSSRKKTRFPIAIAASVTLFLLSGLYIAFLYLQKPTETQANRKPNEAISEKDKEAQIHEILENQNLKPDYLDSTQKEYATIEKQKVSLINKAKANKPILDDGMQELKKLETEYKKLEEDLLISGNENVIEAMNRNLKLREKILEKTQRNIERAEAFSEENRQ